jgi:polyisoprenoid-binding protein YceI
VEGNLTIIGVTKPVSLKVDTMNCGENPFNKKEYRCGFDVSGQVKRSEFGMKFGLPAIGDDLRLHIEIEAVRE